MGRGASFFPAIYKVGSEGFVFGIDNSEGMVRKTNKDLISKSITNGEVKVMNAEKLGFENSTFHNVVCGFGLGYLLSFDNNLSEVKRVIKNGGQVAFSIWGEQIDQRWFTEIVKFNEFKKEVYIGLERFQRKKG